MVLFEETSLSIPAIRISCHLLDIHKNLRLQLCQVSVVSVAAKSQITRLDPGTIQVVHGESGGDHDGSPGCETIEAHGGELSEKQQPEAETAT